MIKRERTLYSENSTTIAKLRQRVQNARMTFGTFMTICMQEYMPVLPPEGGTLCIDVTVWATPYRDV